MIDARIVMAATALLLVGACEESQSVDVQDSPSIVAEGEAAESSIEPLPESPFFRAVGQEPGWIVRMYSHAIVYEADYGERTVTAPTPEAEETENGRRYVTDTLTVEIVEQECADTMSGARYFAQVTVIEGERSLQGCGGEEISGPDEGA